MSSLIFGNHYDYQLGSTFLVSQACLYTEKDESPFSDLSWSNRLLDDEVQDNILQLALASTVCYNSFQYQWVHLTVGLTSP
jgi:hypothetical protein